MKKLTRIACLVAALVLSGFASAGAWPDGGYCYYDCGGQPVWVWAESKDHCCGTQYQCSDNSFAWALWWEQYPWGPDACMIGR
jgi:hypothetical protein